MIDEDEDTGGALTGAIGAIGAGGAEDYFAKSKTRISDMYDSALARMRERYRGPNKQDMLLAIGQALLQPTENGKFSESLANIPGALLQHRMLQRRSEQDLDGMEMQLELARLKGLNQVDLMAAKYGAQGAGGVSSGDAKMLIDAGYVPGTPEFQRAMIGIINNKYATEYVDPEGNMRRRNALDIDSLVNGGGAGPAGNIPRIASDEEYDALPQGAQFYDPKGNLRRKGGAGGAPASGNFR
jgi:hypothetical protein